MESGEFDLIRKIFAPLAAENSAALSLNDDAAILPQRDGWETVVSTDTMVSGVHFLPTENPGAIARRLLRVNLSLCPGKRHPSWSYLVYLSSNFFW